MQVLDLSFAAWIWSYDLTTVEVKLTSLAEYHESRNAAACAATECQKARLLFLVVE